MPYENTKKYLLIQLANDAAFTPKVFYNLSSANTVTKKPQLTTNLIAEIASGKVLDVAYEQVKTAHLTRPTASHHFIWGYLNNWPACRNLYVASCLDGYLKNRVKLAKEGLKACLLVLKEIHINLNKNIDPDLRVINKQSRPSDKSFIRAVLRRF